MTFYNLNMLADTAVRVSEQEQRAKKGKSKIIYKDEEEKKSLLVEEIRKTCNFRREKRSKPFRYLNNGASSSSSSSPKLFSLNTVPGNFKKNYLHFQLPPFTYLPPFPGADSETLNPQNPNSRKRRDVREKRAGIFKKKRSLSFSWKGRDPPEWLRQTMRNMDVNEEPRLIFETALSNADITASQSRLLMPFNQLETTDDFLTPVESNYIKGQGGGGNNDDGDGDSDGMKPGVGAVLVNQSSKMFGVIFKFWEMKKESGKGSLNYILNCGWNDVVSGNKLKEDQTISIWSFRYRGVLCFALVLHPPPPPTMILN